MKQYDIIRTRERKSLLSKAIGLIGMSLTYPIGALLFVTIIGIPLSIPVFAIGSMFQSMFFGRLKQTIIIDDKKTRA